MYKRISRSLMVSVTVLALGIGVIFVAQNAQSLIVEERPDPKDQPAQPQISREGSMTLGGMRDIVKRLDENVREPRPGFFQFIINDFEVSIYTSVPANRMRVMVRVRSSENLTKADLLRIAQANLDSALDARYAVGQGILWSTYIHPLSNLHPRQFIEAIGSTVNLASTYGSTYSSGQLFFGGGDSRGILGRKFIDGLIKKGQPI